MSHSIPNVTRGGVEVRRSKERAKNNRSLKRRRLFDDPTLALGYRPPTCAALRLRHLASSQTSLDSNTLPVASGGWIGKRVKTERAEPWTVKELLNHGFKVHEWDGRYVLHGQSYMPKLIYTRTPHVLLDIKGRVIASLAGRPNDPSWDSAIKQAEAAMVGQRQQGEKGGTFSGGSSHRRGCFTALACGVSFGGGQVVCSLTHSYYQLFNHDF